MATTASIALVEHAFLIQSDGSADAIPVGSLAWYAWLTDANSFTFRSTDGTFTAHKERRSPTQAYWKAYRRHPGEIRRVYLGRSEQLTLDRLNAAAGELATSRANAAASALLVSR